MDDARVSRRDVSVPCQREAPCPVRFPAAGAAGAGPSYAVRRPRGLLQRNKRFGAVVRHGREGLVPGYHRRTGAVDMPGSTGHFFLGVPVKVIRKWVSPSDDPIQPTVA
jgi:hypothetical protein